jgi:hypothetical protein
VVEWRFCGGFCEKLSKIAWFLLVKLWWFAGKCWCDDGLVLAAKKMPLFENISVDFLFWESACALWCGSDDVTYEDVCFFGL